MGKVRLVKPSIEFKEEYLNMINEWKGTGERIIPSVLNIEGSNFENMLVKLQEVSKGNALKNYVDSSTYWLVDNKNRVLGATNIRHSLNEGLLKTGGHIGYGIRPSERRKGYAKEILKLALEKAKELQIQNVLVTCNESNKGSEKTILSNGGVFESVEMEDGDRVKRFWILNN